MNRREIWQALVEGKTIKHAINTAWFKMDSDGDIRNQNGDLCYPHFRDPAIWSISTWEDKLSVDHPVLCKCYDNDGFYYGVNPIVGKNASGRYIDVSASRYARAEPISKEMAEEIYRATIEAASK